MKVLLLTRYGRLGASSRTRSFQYVPWLESQGISICVQSLMPDSYLRHLYQGNRDLGYVPRAFLNRWQAIRGSKAFDLLWVEKELFPWLPYWTEASWFEGPPVILDLDDAIFHNYDLNRNFVVRAFLARKIDRLMARASLVTVGSSYLAERAKGAGAPRVEWLPTVVDLDRFKVHVGNTSSRCVIGWIGTPQTASYLNEVEGALSHLARSKSARVVLIGSGPISLKGIPTEIHSWFEDTEYSKIQLFDIGIMPLPDAPWERGKCGYKLIQYMAAGIPVVASPVGANTEIIDHGVNGFLATNQEEWIEYLSRLSSDSKLRARMGSAGREKVESNYCMQVTAPRLRDLLLSTAKRTRVS